LVAEGGGCRGSAKIDGGAVASVLIGIGPSNPLVRRALRELAFGMADEPLRRRLEQAGVIAEVGAVSSPTLSYVTVQYETRARTLTYTDDVSPSRVPSSARFAVYLALVARLAVLNTRVNVASVS
jgi:hypothetical protein